MRHEARMGGQTILLTLGSTVPTGYMFIWVGNHVASYLAKISSSSLDYIDYFTIIILLCRYAYTVI